MFHGPPEGIMVSRKDISKIKAEEEITGWSTVNSALILLQCLQ